MLSCQLSCQISLYLPSKLFHNCPPLQLIHLLVFPTGILDLKPYKPAHNVHFQPFLPPKTNQRMLHRLPAPQPILRCINFKKSHKIYLQQLPPCPQQKATPKSPPTATPVHYAQDGVQIQQERWHSRLIISQRPLETFTKAPQHCLTKPMLQRNHFIEPSKS
jgi:hypothetical protein